MSDSRTKNSARNVAISVIIQIATILVSFICRTVFIKIMNADYLGVNGLFSNILAILSFSELGISSAIIYNMYKPAYEDDTHKLSALLNFYKVAYRLIAFIVLIIGIGVLPFIDSFINGASNIAESLCWIYILFLLSTVCSYLYSYSRSVFTVYQKDYINTLVERSVWIAMYVFQLLYLNFTHDFYGYLVIQVVATISADIIITHLSRKLYPKITSNLSAKLNIKEIKKIFKDVYSIFFYKVGSIILHSTDNIIIAKIINITIVGICSNYVLIINSLESILQRALNSIVASVGNLNVGKSDNKLSVLYELTLCTNWIYGVCSIMLFVCINPLIQLWIGDTYVLQGNYIVLSIIAAFYIFGSNFPASSYRITMGYFHDARFVPLLAAVLNVILSIFLGLKMGLAGIFISTAIARFFTFNLIDPYLVLKKGLCESFWKYIGFQLISIMIVLLNGLICYYIANLLPHNGIWGFILRLVVIGFLSNMIFACSFFHNQYFILVLKRFHILK